MSTMLEVIRKWRIGRLLVKRAGLKAQMTEWQRCGRGNDYVARKLAEAEEKLRQLGHEVKS